MAAKRFLRIGDDLIVNEDHIVRARYERGDGEPILRLTLVAGEGMKPIMGEDAKTLWDYLSKQAISITPTPGGLAMGIAKPPKR